MNNNDFDPTSGCAGCFIGFALLCIVILLMAIGGMLTIWLELNIQTLLIIALAAFCVPMIIIGLAKILGS